MENTTYEPGVWYGWNGGECPVHPMTVVAVRFRDRHEEYDRCDKHLAENWSWTKQCLDTDIIAFMIITPYVEPRKPREIWVNEYPQDLGLCFDTKEEADQNATGYRVRCTKFVEVIEE